MAGDRHAAAELRVREAGESGAPGYLATEVYVLRAGLVAECRSYIDHEDAQRG